jgi:hypothetical protein
LDHTVVEVVEVVEAVEAGVLTEEQEQTVDYPLLNSV